MNKKIAVLSLSFACAVAFGGSTLVSESNNMQNDLNSTLDKLESYATMTYDWENPQNMLLNGDYSLFYNNGEYGIRNRDYMFYGPYFDQTQVQNTKSNSQQASNYGMNYTQNMNNNNQKSSSTNDSTTTNENNNSKNVYTPSIDSSNTQNSSQNGILSTQSQKNSNNSMSNNQNNTTTTSSQNSNNISSTSLSKNTLNLNNQTNNKNMVTNNIQSSSMSNNKTNSTSNSTNYNTSLTTSNSTSVSRSLTDYSSSLQSTGSSLQNNINTLRTTLNSNTTNLEQSQNRALSAYAYTLKNITKKLEMGNSDLLSNVNKISILNNTQNVESTAKDACNLDIKATLASRMVLLECANEAVTQINSILEGNSTENNTNQQNLTRVSTNQSTTKNTNLNNSNSQNTSISSQSSTSNNQNNTTSNNSNNPFNNSMTITASARVTPEVKTQEIKESSPLRADEDQAVNQEKPKKQGFFKKFKKKINKELPENETVAENTNE